MKLSLRVLFGLLTSVVILTWVLVKTDAAQKGYDRETLALENIPRDRFQGINGVIAKRESRLLTPVAVVTNWIGISAYDRVTEITVLFPRDISVEDLGAFRHLKKLVVVSSESKFLIEKRVSEFTRTLGIEIEINPEGVGFPIG